MMAKRFVHNCTLVATNRALLRGVPPCRDESDGRRLLQDLWAPQPTRAPKRSWHKRLTRVVPVHAYICARQGHRRHCHSCSCPASGIGARRSSTTSTSRGRSVSAVPPSGHDAQTHMAGACGGSGIDVRFKSPRCAAPGDHDNAGQRSARQVCSASIYRDEHPLRFLTAAVALPRGERRLIHSLSPFQCFAGFEEDGAGVHATGAEPDTDRCVLPARTPHVRTYADICL